MSEPPDDWVDSTTRVVPVLLMLAGFVGFCASLTVAIISVRTDLLAMAGLCAAVACGSYFSQALTQARRMPPPPRPPDPQAASPLLAPELERS